MLCAQKGVWTAAELRRKLQDTLQLEVSAVTVSKLLTGTPKNLSLNMLLALCVVLDCSPNDVIVVERAFSKRTAQRLVEDIARVNRVRAPRTPRPGHRRRRPPEPPQTGI